MAIVKPPTAEEHQRAEDQYTLLIGRVSLLWAKIHEDFASFYIYRFSETASNLTQIAWYSHRSDSAQRDLLKETLKRNDIRGAETFPQAREDLIWTIDKISALSRVRNDAIHSAIVLKWGSAGGTIAPNPWSLDPRTAKLENVDLMARLNACRADLEELLGFNRLMFTCCFNPELFSTWPTRPLMTSTSL